MDYYDYDSFCYSARDLKLIRPLVEWPQHPLYHNTLLSSDHGAPRIKQEELGGFQSYPHYQQPWSYDAFNLPSHHSPYSAILLPLHTEASISRQDMDEMTAMIDVGNVEVGDEDAEGEDELEEMSSVSSPVPSSPIPIPVPNQTKKSRGRREDELEEMPFFSSPVASSLPIPIPVPNLTKKSRGRRVPTMSSLEDIRSAASGAGRKRQSVGGKSARMYLCEVAGCGKCFARGEHLKRHVRSIHTYEKPHRCPYPGCGKDFSRHDNLVQHMRVHKDYVLPRSRSSSSSSLTT